MSNLMTISHPLVEHHLGRLRQHTTPPAEFRRLIGRLAVLLACEATRQLELQPVAIRTPLCETEGHTLAQRIGIVPILRAGLAMVEPVLNLIPDAEVWHLGLYRDEETAEPVEYYSRIPRPSPLDIALVLDPMLATGGSARAALAALQDREVPEIILLAVIAARPGIELVQREFPRAKIFVCAVDPQLDQRNFIVPGLGDAGDRSFHTI